MITSLKDFKASVESLLGFSLLGSEGDSSHFYTSIREVYPIHATPSNNLDVRFNILIPTLAPEKFFGGLTTAVEVARKIINEFGRNIDIRVIVTSDHVDRDSVEQISSRMGKTFIKVKPECDLACHSIINLYKNCNRPISIRCNDIFFATAWWTADLGFRLKDKQALFHKVTHPLIYLIQDFEPGFYQWSSKYALSEATYGHPGDTIAIINSEELTIFMLKRYSFKNSYCLPYEINLNISKHLESRTKEKLILVYGRPSTPRNCFELIVEGLKIWQSKNPAINCQFKIIFVGEAFSADLISELENAENLSKVSLERYANLLSSASIGISMMLSPHPSYPPLEMAAAGCITITNSYETKNLSTRSSNVISLDILSPKILSNILDQAINRAAIGKPSQVTSVSRPSVTACKLIDYEDLMRNFSINQFF